MWRLLPRSPAPPSSRYGSGVGFGAARRTSCTLRFCARPSAVSLDATGRASPKPVAVMLARGTPLDTR